MKINYQTILKTKLTKLWPCIILFGSIIPCSAQLSGTYTIDSASSSSGTNYASWADFSNDINTNGVNGPVIINVLTDQNEPQVQFNAIAGVSSSNTVTINGNGKILASGVADAVILLNGADYFIFDSLVIRNTLNSTNAQGFRLLNGADYNVIRNSIIEFSALTSTSSSGGAYISFSTSATSRTASSSTNHGAYNLIDGNIMRTTNTNSPGPTFGIAIQGSSSTYASTEQNNTISNNVIQNFYYYAIRNYYSNGNQIINNDISRSNATSNNCNSTLYGIYSYYAYSGTRQASVEGNILHDWPYLGSTVTNAPTTVYAFYTNYCYGTATYRFSLSDNQIRNVNGKTNLYLGYNFYNYYFDLLNNFADNNDVTVSTSSSYNFHGWYNGYTYNSYRFNGNTIQNCDGGYYWYGIRNYYPQSVNGVQEINDNIIQDNAKSYYYTYRIYSYYAQYSSSSYPISIMRNVIRDNSADYYYTYNIYTYYYGTYDITDNVISENTSGYYYMYDIYNYYYGNYDIRRNKIIGNNNLSGNAGYHYCIYNYYNYDVNITDNLITDNNGYYYTYGIYAYSFQNGTYTANIRQNTIKIDAKKSNYSSHYSYGIYCYMYYHRPTVNGNIIDISGNYGAYPVYTNNSVPANIKWDKNLYYVNSVSVQNWYSPSGTANSFTAWNNLGFAGNDEKYGDPKWNDPSTYDYRSNSLLSQNNIPFNSLNDKDVNGVLRNTTKNDKGALENMLDISQEANDFSPDPQECTGFTFSPTITLKNNFLDAITGFDMGVTVNGVLVGTKTVTTNIPVNSSGTVTMNPILFSQAGTQVVKFFILDADDEPSNDTISYTFFVKKSPGGSALTLNTSKSAPKAHYDITGKPDITTNGQAIVYDLGQPATVGYVNSDHVANGSTKKWTATVTAYTTWGVSVPGATITAPSGSTNAFVTFNPAINFVDSTISLCVKVSDLISGCDTSYCRKILVAPQGVPDFKLQSVLCDKDEVFFENISTVSSGNLLSIWDFGDGSPTSDATNPVYTYNGPGTYTVKLTIVTLPYGYETVLNRTIVINEIPQTDFKITNACEGNAVKLTNTTVIGSGVLSYEWDMGDGSQSLNTVNVSKIYPAPGGYKVTLSAKGNGCMNVISKNVYQFAKPVASFTRVSGVCENDQFSFVNTSTISNGQIGYNWDFDDAGNKATVREPLYDFMSSGTKNVKLKAVSEFGCVDSAFLPIVVKTIPSSGFIAPFACSRTATQFLNTTKLNGEILDRYAWDFGDGYTSSAFAPQHNWTGLGPKLVKLRTILTNGCSDEVSQLLNVGVQPKVDFSFVDQCAGSEVNFSNLTTFSQGNISYQWDFGDNTGSGVNTPSHVYLIGAGTQTFIVKLKASIAGGCEDSLVKTININPLPTTCDFDLVRDYSTSLTGYKFTPTGGITNGIRYTWLTGDGNSIQSNATGASYSYRLSGKYCVTMVASNAADCECTTTKCMTLTTGINDLEWLERAVSIYPNPANGVFSVTVDKASGSGMDIVVYNSVGELVKTVNAENNTLSIDLSDYAAGVYMIKVTIDGQSLVKKISLCE